MLILNEVLSNVCLIRMFGARTRFEHKQVLQKYKF